MSVPEIIRFENTDTLVRSVADRWLDLIHSASNVGHHVALSGGRVAGRFMAAAAERSRSRGVSWDDVDFYWGDERCVPPEHADSNYRLADEALLTPLGIAADKRHRLRGELPPAEAARLAEEELRSATRTSGGSVPVLDLVFLGMGEDGHVASLFPEAPQEVIESRALVLPVIGPKPPPQRLTLTFPVLAAAREVWVLASGAGKEQALRESLAPGLRTPLARLLSQRGSTRIFTDIA
jgi:6-phosphogluconolactonase